MLKPLSNSRAHFTKRRNWAIWNHFKTSGHKAHLYGLLILGGIILRIIFYLFEIIGFGRFAKGSGGLTLNRNDVHNYCVSFPSNSDEYTVIDSVLSDMDAADTAMESKMEKARRLMQAMIHNLLTGKIRLE